MYNSDNGQWWYRIKTRGVTETEHHNRENSSEINGIRIRDELLNNKHVKQIKYY